MKKADFKSVCRALKPGETLTMVVEDLMPLVGGNAYDARQDYIFIGATVTHIEVEQPDKEHNRRKIYYSRIKTIEIKEGENEH